MVTNARHMHETNRWGTPDREPHQIIPRARRLLGGFDLDPCSEEQFQKNILATTYYSLTERLRLQGNVENLFEKKYYINADSNTNISPGFSRAVRVGVIARF